VLCLILVQCLIVVPFGSFYSDLSQTADTSIRPGSVKNRTLIDIFDGTVLQDLIKKMPEELRDFILWLVLCSDGVEVQKDVTWTPVTAKIMNWPSGVRSLLGAILMLAVFPPHVKNYDQMFLPIVEQLAALAPRTGTGFTVNDIVRFVVMAIHLNDTRGVPGGCCGSHAPCYNGSCVHCVVPGQYHHSVMVLPGSVRGLPDAEHCTLRQRALRAKYATEFAGCKRLAELADKIRPQSRTHTSCLKSGRRCTGKTKSKTAEAFHGVACFSRLLWYHKIPLHNRYDEAHTFANHLKNEIAYIGVRQPPVHTHRTPQRDT
jgi:hypothetical protein